MTLAVKVALNPNITNQPTKVFSSGNGLKVFLKDGFTIREDTLISRDTVILFHKNTLRDFKSFD